MIDKIKAIILDAIPDAVVEVSDPRNDGHHFEARVISSLFEDMSLVKQHQMVMKALKNAFDSETMHALQLKTLTPKDV